MDENLDKKDLRDPKLGEGKLDDKRDGKKDDHKRGGRRGGYRGGRRHDDKPKIDPKFNDAAWYLQTDMVSDSIQLLWPVIAGFSGSSLPTKVTFPTVGRVYLSHIAPSMGKQGAMDGDATPLELAANIMYTYFRGRYSNSVPFEAEDLALYVIAEGNIIAWLQTLKRDIELAKTFSAKNMFTPKCILACLGYSDEGIEELRANYANYILELNLLIDELSGLLIPPGIPYFAKCAWIGRYLWFDDSSDWQGDLYGYKIDTVDMFTPYMGLNIGDDTDPNYIASTGLIALDVSTLDNFAAKLEVAKKLVHAMVNDDNARAISAWMYQALVKSSKLPEAFIDYVGAQALTPEKSDEVKLQFKNNFAIGSINGRVSKSETLADGHVYTTPIPDAVFTDFKDGDCGRFKKGWKMKMYGSRTYFLTEAEQTAMAEAHTRGTLRTLTNHPCLGAQLLMARPDILLVSDKTDGDLSPAEVMVATRHIPVCEPFQSNLDNYTVYCDLWYVTHNDLFTLRLHEGQITSSPSASVTRCGYNNVILIETKLATTVSGPVSDDYLRYAPSLIPTITYGLGAKPVLFEVQLGYYTVGTRNVMGNPGPEFVYEAIDYTKFTNISKDMLKKWHIASIYSQMGVNFYKALLSSNQS